MTYKNTFIVGNIYGLFVSLLICPEDEIDKSLFFIDTVINKSTVKKAPKNTVWVDYTLRDQKGVLPAREQLLFRLKMRLKYWYIRFTKIFAQDNIPSASPIIGCNKYNEMEDAPYLLSLYKDSHRLQAAESRKLLSQIKQFLKRGPIAGNILGRNRFCVNRYVSLIKPEDRYTEILNGKPITEIKLDELWQTASDKKKEYILRTFGINKDDLCLMQSASTIICTQPLIDDAGLTLEEQIQIYRPYVEKYEDDGVIIKPHPREKINYKEFFPKAIVLQAGIPMQIYNALGANFKRAITVCSTAISSMMKDDTEVIWLGSKIHPNVCAAYGDITFKK